MNDFKPMSDKLVHKNIMAMKYHCDTTRQQVNELREEVKALQTTLGNANNTIAEMQKQIQLLQVRLFSGGGTS